MDTVLKYMLLENESDNTASFKSTTRNRRKNDEYSSFKIEYIYVMLSHLSNSWCSSNAGHIVTSLLTVQV